MLNQTIQDALNKQLNAEFFTTNNYLAMSAKFRNKGLYGFAHWCRVQAKQEQKHGMKIFDFIGERQGQGMVSYLAHEKIPDTFRRFF